jgi:hypothetical protein
MIRKQETLRDEYFSWLYEIVNEKKRSYKKLCHIFHEKKFRWFVQNDDNRYMDGVALRQIFVDVQKLDEEHTEVSYFLKGGECTIFEMLVSLAQRIDELTYNLEDQQNRTPKWFLEMVQNLGLDCYTDVTLIDPKRNVSQNEAIDSVLETLLDRTYDAFGTGSLFPLKRRPQKHMAKVEIWYQLMIYLDENYG